MLASLGKLIDSNPSAARIELAVNDAEGRRRLIDLTVTDLTKHPEVEGYVLNGRDVTEATQLKADLMHAAYHDALTGLPNRTQFTSDVARSLRDVHGSHPAVLFIDLDDFKTINDGLGHAAGDHVLRTVAGRLTEAAGPDDVAARLGGDEFALLVPDGGNVEVVEALANKILDSDPRAGRRRRPADDDERQHGHRGSHLGDVGRSGPAQRRCRHVPGQGVRARGASSASRTTCRPTPSSASN